VLCVCMTSLLSHRRPGSAHWPMPWTMRRAPWGAPNLAATGRTGERSVSAAPHRRRFALGEWCHHPFPAVTEGRRSDAETCAQAPVVRYAVSAEIGVGPVRELLEALAAITASYVPLIPREFRCGAGQIGHDHHIAGPYLVRFSPIVTTAWDEARSSACAMMQNVSTHKFGNLAVCKPNRATLCRQLMRPGVRRDGILGAEHRHAAGPHAPVASATNSSIFSSS